MVATTLVWGEAMNEEAKDEQRPRRLNSLEDRNAVVESAVDQAIKRGDFDDLPGLGRPLKSLRNSEDPDWWIKQKMDQENISGVAPAAFQLRKENAVLEDTLDVFAREADVRDYLAGFNERVRAAVMDLREGPPIFTPPRDVDREVAAWRRRRASSESRRADTDDAMLERAETEGRGRGDEGRPRRWWRRRRR